MKSANYIDDDDLANLKARLIPKGTTIFAKIGEAIRSNRRAITTKECVIDNNTAGIKAKEGKANDLFVFYAFSKVSLIEHSGGVVPSVNKTTMESIRLAFPKPPEQQKIAACLTSLDDLIAAQGQKVAALKAHKKGLMQQLFPAPGKTTLRLRFPEFRNAPPWEEKRLSEISPAIFDGTHQTPSYIDEGIPFFSVENIVSGKLNKYISLEDHNIATRKNKPAKGDILITRIGKIGFSQVVDWDHEFSIYVTLAVIKSSKTFDSCYLHFYLQSESYQSEILKNSLLNAVPCKINMDELRKTNILLPKPPEQERIAACLSSLDDLITAQGQKVAALKAHKKGLMQQLFPASDEGIA